MEALQTDVVSLFARDLQRLLREAVDRGMGLDGGMALVETQRPIAQMLLRWDCALRADSPEAALYEMWADELRNAVTARAVPAQARSAFGKMRLSRVVQELSNPQNALFGSDPRAARDAMLLTTLDAARLKLVARQGPDIEQWTWGQLHRIKFQHSLDSAPEAAALFDRGPMKRPGDGEVVQATEFRGDSFDQVSGASYREIFDLADWDRSVAINVPGQSGQPQAKHYDDLLPLWIEGRYFPLAYTKAAVDAVTTDVLRLVPGPKIGPH
jgi:penicillin amidase